MKTHLFSGLLEQLLRYVIAIAFVCFLVGVLKAFTDINGGTVGFATYIVKFSYGIGMGFC
jgi:type III secretory pathway component EscS